MKNIRITRVLACVVVAMLLLSGCSARSATTTKDFKTNAESVGFIVKEQIVANPDIASLMVARDEKTDAETDFVVFKTEQAAVTAYNALKADIPTTVQITKPKNVDSSSYNKYIVENGELYYVLVRMNSTVAYSKCKIAQKDKTDSLFRSINY